MTGKYNKYNLDLKCKLKAHSIRYADLVKATGYSRMTILNWLRVPCDAARVAIIEQAIEKIEEDRRNGLGYKYTRTLEISDSPAVQQNLDMRLRLDSLNITQADIAREIRRNRTTIQFWLRVPLTHERRKIIEGAVDTILERRKNEPPPPPPTWSYRPSHKRRSAPKDKGDQQSEKREVKHRRPKTGLPRYTAESQALPWKGQKENYHGEKIKMEPPSPKEEQPHTAKYVTGNQILPWKGANVNDQRGTCDKNQKRGKRQD